MYIKRTAIIAALLGAALAAGAVKIYDEHTMAENGGNLLKAKKIIIDNYVEELSDEQVTKMEDAAISAMVESLNDPYSQYLNTDNYEQFEENNEEEYIGVGVNVSFRYSDETLTVTSPMENSPAQRSGILPGDIITKIDGVLVTADSYSDAIDHIKEGKEGDVVTFTIKRGAEDIEFKVACEKIYLQSVSSKMLDNSIGYIRISQFLNSTVKDFEKALFDLKNQEMKGLVIDLRSNPGGYAHSVLSVADYILPKGVIAYLEDNQGRRQYFNSDARCLSIPMTILINRGTASAAELLAGSVKAYDMATLIGEKSYGKAVGQSPYKMQGTNAAIYLTNSRYFTPKGECIDKLGIEPDIKIDLADELLANLPSLTLYEDAQLSKAVDVLLSEMNENN